MSFLQDKKIGLSSNVLKIIAAISMVIDHMGFMFFPSQQIFRIIGRLAFPIFSYFIAEGCKYTKNKWSYFSKMFVCGIVYYVVYYLFDNGASYGNIFLTFSISIVLIFILQELKSNIFSEKKNIFNIVLSALLFACAIFATLILTDRLTFDYGFWGVMVPVFVSLCDISSKNIQGKKCSDVEKNREGYYQTELCSKCPQHINQNNDDLDSKLSNELKIKRNVLWTKIVDNHYVECLLLFVSLMLLAVGTNSNGWSIQWYGLLAIIPLLLYNGERGKLKMKWFFYIFYPVHLVLLEGIYYLLYMI